MSKSQPRGVVQRRPSPCWAKTRSAALLAGEVVLAKRARSANGNANRPTACPAIFLGWLRHHRHSSRSARIFFATPSTGVGHQFQPPNHISTSGVGAIKTPDIRGGQIAFVG